MSRTAPAPTVSDQLDYCSEEYNSTFKRYCIIFGQPTQAEQTFRLAVIFILIFKEDGHMSKAKYIKNAQGYFETKVWNGTYRNGKKHYISLYSKKPVVI